MMRMATNCVSDSGDLCKYIAEADTFGEEVECGEDNRVVIFWTFFFHQVFVCWKSCRKYRCWSILLM